MGYLKQRKNEERTDIALKSMFVMLLLLLIGSFYGDGEGLLYYINAFSFHYYIITIGVFIYCLYRHFFVYSGLFFLLVLLGFMSLGASSRILFNDLQENSNELTILYINGVKQSNYEKVLEQAEKSNVEIIAINSLKKGDASDTSGIIFSNKNSLREGLIRLSIKYNAYFTLIDFNEKEMMLVDVDFSGISPQELAVVFHNLTEFVKLQTVPVVVFGDFGITAWNETFVEFLASTNLEVKNRVIMTNGKLRFNPFVIPTINIVGYKKLGLEKITFLPKFKSKKHPILFEVSF